MSRLHSDTSPHQPSVEQTSSNDDDGTGQHPSLHGTMINLVHTDSNRTVLGMQDDLGIVYLIESAQQFWSELEDILRLPQDEPPTLSLLDATLHRFLALCATYHEQFLQSPLQLEHACELLLDSELFEFHSERMLDILTDDAQKVTDPHSIFIFYEVLFCYGRRRQDFFRSHKRWEPLFPFLMDHVLVEIDPDIEDTYAGTAPGRGSTLSVPIPIEAKLRSLSMKTLYEVCKVQTLTVSDLKIFDDAFIDYLLDLVEQTKYMQDETFNYSVIKLIIALNEQFMVAGLGDEELNVNGHKVVEPKNRVIRVMMRRQGSCKTMGENMIFMLNRAKDTPEDYCLKLLILKILYVLFSTKGMSEFFYTNDLCVLVDVFLRELNDLDDESESLRHTYLRVLHPLLTRTQLKDTPYKRPQILVALESMVSNSRIREVTPTTQRLVERCLSGAWSISLMELRKEAGYGIPRVGSPGSDASTILSPTNPLAAGTSALGQSDKIMKMKFSKSVENFGRIDTHLPSGKQPLRSPLDQIRRPSNASVQSLPGFGAGPSTLPAPHAHAAKKRSTSAAPDAHPPSRHNSLPPPPTPTSPSYSRTAHHHHPPRASARSDSIHAATAPEAVPTAVIDDPPVQPEQVPRRRPPPPAPPKRRKPPAIPMGHTNSGATITSIRSSEPSPLSKVHKPHVGVTQAS